LLNLCTKEIGVIPLPSIGQAQLKNEVSRKITRNEIVDIHQRIRYYVNILMTNSCSKGARIKNHNSLRITPRHTQCI
jgi:hypothetical protein